ncbi:MAG TPA: transglycosylase SLT domain-containing protein [Thermoanaerobaculia bacterium]|nr:transglycosylase SLT domain-containing protein [Thermoanaerobaculia bacterium]
MASAFSQPFPEGRSRRRRDGARKVSLAEWRVICPCQQHGTMRVVHRTLTSSRQALRNPYAALILSVPIAFGAAGFPMVDSEQETPAKRIPVAAVQPTTSEVSSAMFLSDDQLSMIRDELPLRLITPSIRRDFLSVPPVPDVLSLDLVKAEFFRTEIPYGAIIYKEAKRHGLQPELVAAVVEAESDFRPRLLSHKNAHGLMQLIPSTGKLMGAKDLLDPADNVRAGARYLRYLHDRFKGDQTLILAAYNAGPTAVRRFGGVPPFKETQNYLKRVNRSKAKFERRIATRHSALVEMVGVRAD